jgi:hypothetical protein
MSNLKHKDGPFNVHQIKDHALEVTLLSKMTVTPQIIPHISDLSTPYLEKFQANIFLTLQEVLIIKSKRLRFFKLSETIEITVFPIHHIYDVVYIL